MKGGAGGSGTFMMRWSRVMPGGPPHELRRLYTAQGYTLAAGGRTGQGGGREG